MVISALYAPAGEQGDGLFVSVPLQMNKGIETKEPSPRLLFGIMGGAVAMFYFFDLDSFPCGISNYHANDIHRLFCNIQ